MKKSKMTWTVRIAALVLPVLMAAGCAGVSVPGGRILSVPTVTPPIDRTKALNEERDPITRVKLGKDVLIPLRAPQDPMPEDDVGPYELRNETLASALQMVLDDYDVSLAFESDKGMTTRISVANLHGKLSQVINRMCELADLYCSYRDHTLTVKDTETFIVDLPPLAVAAAAVGDTSGTTGGTTTSSTTTSSSSSSSSGTSSGSTATYTDIVTGLKAITNTTPTIDQTTRVLIYTATQRSQHIAEQYFDRLRKNTALIIYETHIWEVTLNNDNQTGIDWSLLGKRVSIKAPITAIAGSLGGSPITITPLFTHSQDLTPKAALSFISEQGSVKTISQPQLTVLSGSSASLSVKQAQNYVAGSTTTLGTNGAQNTTTSTTGTTTTGLDITIASSWDQSTVYGTISISISDLLSLDTFITDTTTGSSLQLPKTTQRNLSTQVRVRPGDTILIGGLVTQKDNYTGSGPGFMTPLFTTARSATIQNTELVFLLRPRVVAFIPGDDKDTPPVVNAPSEGYIAPVGLPDNSTEPDRADIDVPDAPVKHKKPYKLPDGISPAALAPQNGTDGEAAGGSIQLPAPEVSVPAPASRQAPLPVPANDMAPVPLASPAPVPQTGKKNGGSVNE